MGTVDPFIRFLVLPGRQEPEAVFGFALRTLPDMSASLRSSGVLLQERLREAFSQQVRMIQMCWGSGITALDLRFLRTRNEAGLSIVLLCRLRLPFSIHPQHMRDRCLALAQRIQQLFAEADFVFVPLADEALLDRYLSPFHISSIGEIRKKEEILVIRDVYVENEVYVTYPWSWSAQNSPRLLETLLHQQDDCLVSVYLEPTQLSPQEQAHLGHATSPQVKSLLWSAGTQGEEIYDLYRMYARNLHQPFLLRISLASTHTRAIEPVARSFIDQLTAPQRTGSQPVLVLPQNQQEWQAACQSIWYLSWFLWGANRGTDVLGTARLRYLVDAATASAAFRLPLGTAANIAGIPIRTLDTGSSQAPVGQTSSSATTPTTTFVGTSSSNATTDIIRPKSTSFDFSKMRGLEDLVGQTLGSCEIEALLGKGGFGAVYRARQSRLQRIVAVKVILASLALPPGTEDERHERQKMLLRFDREAQALARLDHPHILSLYEYQQHPLPYLVMPYIAGGSLADELQASRHQPVPVQKVATILSQVASALDQAHQQRIVHRDLKPQNLLRHADGRILLSDFGIVQFEDAEMTALTTGHHSPYTQAYASPEQHQWLPVDYRTDIYSLGVIIYELLCGRRPFKLPYEHVHTPPPPFRSSGVEIAPALEAIVHKALSKHPENRYPSAGAMAAAFQAALPS